MSTASALRQRQYSLGDITGVEPRDFIGVRRRRGLGTIIGGYQSGEGGIFGDEVRDRAEFPSPGAQKSLGVAASEGHQYARQQCKFIAKRKKSIETACEAGFMMGFMMIMGTCVMDGGCSRQLALFSRHSIVP